MDSSQEGARDATMSPDLDSSFLSTPPSSILSSPLSSPGCTPSPPPEVARRIAQLQNVPYPSPPASQQTSPPPDGMESHSATDKEGPPPAKRRKISKERTTEYLDLQSDNVDPDQQAELDHLLHVLHKRRKIVVIAGAGISVSAGIPDFRSANGLFRSLKDEHKLKGSGKDLFDASVYKDDSATSSFHDMVSSMSRMTRDAKPTAFHHMLATIASEGRLLRLYSQNVDGLDTSLPPLETMVPLRKNESGKWPCTVQLHGGLDKMVCTKCRELSDLDADLFSGPIPPACPNCEEFNSIRVNHEGKRSHGIGRLRPRMVLYNEANPDDTAIGSVTSDDLRKRPDAVIVAGTTLKVPGVKRIVREMCKTVRDRRGGVAVWINTDQPPVVKELEDCFDIVVQGTCDEVAARAAMRRWDEPPEEDAYSELSDEAAKKANARTAEVHLPRCTLSAAAIASLPSDLHINNSFAPPSMDTTPKKPLPSPTDWSPMLSRSSSVLPSIEAEESVVANSSGSTTPQKSQYATIAKQQLSLNEKLMNVAQSKKAAGKAGKNVGTGPRKTSKSKQNTAPKTKAKSSAKFNEKANVVSYASLKNNFKTTKAGIVETPSAKKLDDSPKKTPSKLRQVANASEQPMHVIPPHDPRINTSPSKARPCFPGLMSENVVLTAIGGKRSSIQDLLNP